MITASIDNTEDHLAREAAGSRQTRFLELLLILGVAILPHILTSLFAYFGWITVGTENANDPKYILESVRKLTLIGLLVYVLHRQGRRLKDIGWEISWKDVPRSIALMIVVMVALIPISGMLLVFFGPARLSPQNIDFGKF